MADNSRQCEVYMRRLAASIFAITLLAHLPATRVIATSSISDHSATMPTSASRAVVDGLVFATPLNQFRAARSRAKRTHRWLITTTDGCSAPLVGSSGQSFNFRVACERHDLAYANYSALSRLSLGVDWNPELRAAVDNQFQRDLQESCIRRRHSERLRCDAWTVVFFHAVRIAAGP
jgi:hypothetical protein